jgi:hypothetical protein
MPSLTVPLPVPLLPEDTSIQLTLLAAAHAHAAGAVTPTDTVAAPLPTSWLDGDTATEHAASWVTVNVRSATVIVPVRDDPVLGAAAYWTDPFPVPVPPALTASQPALLAALQPQPSAARTSNLAEPPSAAAVADVGASV